MKKLKAGVSPSRLRELFDYDPDTGELRWKERTDVPLVWNARFAGKPVTCVLKSKRLSYLWVSIDKSRYLGHRVIWAWYYGKWPEQLIDHIDGDGLNNRIANLREVSNGENMRNGSVRKDNTTGVPGVHWDSKRGLWAPEINYDGCRIHLGRFSAFEEAVAARKRAEKAFGFHHNHGKRRSGEPVTVTPCSVR